MTTVRSAKNKGSQAEYSCRDSLLPIMPDILLTKQLGFVSQYDLVSHVHKTVFEVKRHKCFTWNELVGWFKKLEKNAPIDYSSVLLFQANHQPCLIMLRSMENRGELHVMEFEKYYKTPFVKHKGTKKVKNNVMA